MHVPDQRNVYMHNQCGRMKHKCNTESLLHRIKNCSPPHPKSDKDGLKMQQLASCPIFGGNLHFSPLPPTGLGATCLLSF